MPSSFIFQPSTFAIIPVKTLRRSKSRLARALKAPVRAALTKSILSCTLDLLQQVDRITYTLVISSDITVLDLARSKQAIDLVESESGLNAAIKQAVTWSMSRGAESILIVPSDLPLITANDFEAMFDLAIEPRCVVIAPDRRGEGTNALLVRPPDAIDFAFGATSFHTHSARAKDRGLALHVYESASIGLDLDVPDDLALYRSNMVRLDAGAVSE
jgi:2-phospho-L-lactate guanylyltransferase